MYQVKLSDLIDQMSHGSSPFLETATKSDKPATGIIRRLIDAIRLPFIRDYVLLKVDTEKCKKLLDKHVAWQEEFIEGHKDSFEEDLKWYQYLYEEESKLNAKLRSQKSDLSKENKALKNEITKLIMIKNTDQNHE
jgi:hypothetical protein